MRPFEKGVIMKKIEKQVQEYIDYCENVRRMSAQTMHGRKWVYKSLLESAKINSIEDITNQHINDWILEQTARGCSGRTINTRIATVIAMLRYFQDMGVNMPKIKLRLIMKQKEAPANRVYYTKEQIEQVLRYANGLDEWLLIRLCFDCGFRISELRNLRLMNLDGRRISFVGKGNKPREAYMSEEARVRLDDWIRRERITDYLWEIRDKHGSIRHLTIEDLRYRMRKPFFAAGYSNFYPHALRHSFATDVVENGAPLPIAKEMLGHSNVATTERYVHSFEGHLGEYFQQYKFQAA